MFLFFFACVTVAAAVSWPLAYADHRKRGAMFKAAISLFAALVAFSAAVVQELAPRLETMLPVRSVEIGGMIAAGWFIYSALSACARTPRHQPRVTSAILILLWLVLTCLDWLASSANAMAMAALFWLGCTVLGLLRFRWQCGPWLKSSGNAAPVIALAMVFLMIHATQLLRILDAFQGSEILLFVVTPMVLAGLLAFAFARLGRVLQPGPPNYLRSGLTAESADDLFCRIGLLMSEGRPFKQTDFDRNQLAGLLDVTPRSVGEAVNRRAQMSVPRYIRSWRLKEAERLMRRPENSKASLESLALEAGFKSRSSFYAAVAETHHQSPGDLRNRIVSEHRP